jgi:hypothetical protein
MPEELKEIIIKIKIQNDTIKVAAMPAGFQKGIGKRFELAGIYSYLHHKELSKLETLSKTVELNGKRKMKID